MTFITVGSGTTNPSSTHSYNINQQVPISATPGNGYRFLSWSASPSNSVTFASSSSASTTATIKAASTITATFSPLSYQVNFVTSGGGIASLTNPSGTQTYTYGQQVPISASPGNGYTFSSWSAVGSVTLADPSAAFTTATINGAGTITAAFTQNNYTVSVAINPSSNAGTVTGYVKTQTYHYSDVVTLSESPNNGYTFQSWGGDGSGNATTCQITVTRDMSITLTFLRNTYTVWVAINPSTDAGTVTANTTGPYQYGDVVILTESPKVGYVFSGWSGNGTGANETRTLILTGNMTVSATFNQSAYSVSATVLPLSSAGTVTANATEPYHYGDAIALTQVSNTGYSFIGWSGDGTGTGATRIVTITGNMSVTATFAQITYSVSFAIIGGGSGPSTSPSGTNTYSYDQQVSISAIASSGYRFSSWSASGSITFDDANSASTRAIIKSDGTITATFQLNPTPSPSQAPTLTPAPITPHPQSPSPEPSNSPNQNLTSQTILATSSDGSSVYIVINGVTKGSDIPSATITPDQTAKKTTVSLTLTGQEETNGSCNIIIPKEAIAYVATPAIYVNDQVAEKQGYRQDANNYYLWYNTSYNTYQLSVVFTTNSVPQYWAAIVVVIISIVLVVAIILPKVRNKS